MQVLRQHIRKLSKKQFLEIRQMCLHSNSLYNSCLYIVNQFFKETNKYIGLTNLYHQIKINIHYVSLPRKCSNQILKLVDKNFRSFFTLLRKKHLGQYSGDISTPKYRKPKSEFVLILEKQQVNIRNNFVKITKNLKIPFSLDMKGELKQAIIKPKGGNYYEIHLAYEPIEAEKPKNLDKTKYLSIDLGLDNLATCFSNCSRDLIISGAPIKSYNQFYNKIKAETQSELKLKNNKHWSKKLNKLSINRENWINNYFNQSVNKIVEYCIDNHIGTIICGYNESWKTEMNMGAKNNQNFISIPHYKLKEKLKNKSATHNISFILQEESYTSKCSSLDKEKVQKHDKYIGSRVERGLFQGSKFQLNADINGAINIMRKAIGDAATFAYKSIERCTVHPVKLLATDKNRS